MHKNTLKESDFIEKAYGSKLSFWDRSYYLLTKGNVRVVVGDSMYFNADKTIYWFGCNKNYCTVSTWKISNDTLFIIPKKEFENQGLIRKTSFFIKRTNRLISNNLNCKNQITYNLARPLKINKSNF